MSRIYTYGIAAFATLSLMLGLYIWGRAGWTGVEKANFQVTTVTSERNAAQAALNELNRDLLRNQELEIARQVEDEKQRLAAEKQLKALKKVLDENPKWSAVPVPDGVWDALLPESNPGSAKAAAAGKPLATVPGASTKPARQRRARPVGR